MLKISNPSVGDIEMRAVKDILESGMLAQGPKVAEFEEAFASVAGTKYAVAVNSGTAALHTALLAAGVGEGDEVITTPFSFIATANSILFCGARPVFVDIDESTFNIGPALIEKKITPKTKALMIVHLYGQPCDMDEVLAICRNHELTLIEDACQAHGARYQGKEAGSFGIGCFSFYPTKNMTTGEGGIITTSDPQIAEKARVIRNHGQSERYLHESLGYNYRMTDIAAAIGICQIEKLAEFNRKRVSNASFLTEEIQQINGLIPPLVAPGRNHVFHQYTIRVTDDFGMSRDTLKEKLYQKGIMTGIYYPIPIHKQPLYREMGYDEYLPVSEKAAVEVLSLPVRPGLSEEDLKFIIQGLKDA
ncbi:MAG: DegT/DnrJ/EryC1/StrS family aminotransferase [Dehalococcoidia bacterium]